MLHALHGIGEQPGGQLILGPASTVFTMPHFRCNAAQLGKVRLAMKRDIELPEVRTIILAAVEQAQSLANDAWFALHPATLPADTEQVFKASFGVASTARLETGGSTQHRIASARYKGAIRKLGDNDVHVSCWGWPWGGMPTDKPDTYFTNNIPRRHGIALGAGFWRAIQAGDTVSPAAALLGTALNLFYYRILFKTGSKTVRAGCYVRFALIAAKAAVPQWVESRCAA